MESAERDPDRSGPRDAMASEPLLRIEPIPVRASFERAPSQAGGWRLVAVEPGAPGEPLQLELHRDEAQGYYLNVTADEPSIFVLWRVDDGYARAESATLSYDEAARWMDGGELVDRVPMAGEMVQWLAEYVGLHYRPENGRKRRGTKPSFMPRAEFAAMADREAAGGGAPIDRSDRASEPQAGRR